MFDFHGVGGTAAGEEAHSGLSATSDADGFLVVYPQGLSDPDFGLHWNFLQAPNPEPNDVAFVNTLLDSLEASLCIDPFRVFSTGFSNGAAMSVRLACSLSNRIAAVAPVSGAYYPPDILSLNPAETCEDVAAVPILAFHGTADTTNPFAGGVGYGGLSSALLTRAADVERRVTDATTGERGRQESQVAADVRLIEYGSCRDGSVVQLYAVDGGYHAWPGPGAPGPDQEIDANDLIWAFILCAPGVPPVFSRRDRDSQRAARQGLDNVRNHYGLMASTEWRLPAAAGRRLVRAPEAGRGGVSAGSVRCSRTASAARARAAPSAAASAARRAGDWGLRGRFDSPTSAAHF